MGRQQQQMMEGGRGALEGGSGGLLVAPASDNLGSPDLGEECVRLDMDVGG